MVSSFSSFRTVENQEFKNLLQKAISIGARHGNISVESFLMSRKSASRKTESLYTELKAELISKLKSSDSVAFSTDVWTNQMGSFIDISIYMVTNFELSNNQLAMDFFDEKHTGDNIHKYFKELF